MPPNERCPCCGELVPDWHREWHSREDQAKIFQESGGMECPLCGDLVMHGRWFTPLAPVPAGTQVERVKRNVILAAYWAANNGGSLEEYMKTQEGQPYAHVWSAAAVQQADQHVTQNP